jgi:hypothetical protein
MYILAFWFPIFPGGPESLTTVGVTLAIYPLIALMKLAMLRLRTN